MLSNFLSSTATLSPGFTWSSFSVTPFGLCPATLAPACQFFRESVFYFLTSAQLTCFFCFVFLNGSLRSSQTIHERWRAVNPGRWTGDPAGGARSHFGGEMNTEPWTQPSAGDHVTPVFNTLAWTSCFTWYWTIYVDLFFSLIGSCLAVNRRI